MRHEQKFLLLACTFGVALLAAAAPRADGRRPRLRPPPGPTKRRLPTATPGAIYAQGTEVSLWQNVTARNVGDTLTIRLAESTGAEKNASDHGQQVEQGRAHRPDGVRPAGHRQWRADPRRHRWTTSPDFAGNGASKQSNTLDGAISVTVAKRFPNGNLLVRGQKWITINTGREFVRVRGHRASLGHRAGQHRAVWKVADAYISYGGQGTVANASKPGWLYRFFNSPHTPSESGHSNMYDIPYRRICWLAALILAWCLLFAAAQAERVKDLAQVQGVRTNQLVGYGLVVGLDGTGDQTSQTPFTHPEHQEHAHPLRGHHSAQHQSAAQERRRGHGARRPAAVRQDRARPSTSPCPPSATPDPARR